MKIISGLKMAEITWLEIRQAFKAGWPVVIPLGAECKEHGLHLPMNTDFLLAEYFAKWIKDNYPVLIAPTISYSYFPAFCDYDGSTTLSEITARNSIIEIIDVWATQMNACNAENQKKVYVFNTGISSNKPLNAAREKLKEKDILLEYFDLSMLYEHPDIKKIMQQKLGTHADEIETSMMLYIKPEIVHMEKAKPELTDHPGALTPNPDATDKAYSATGAWGDPTKATREKGEIAVNLIKNMLKKQLAELIETKSLNNSFPFKFKPFN